MLYDLFSLLDKNQDGLISKQDFMDLFEGKYLFYLANGIEDQNEDFL